MASLGELARLSRLVAHASLAGANRKPNRF
jgi:hypothetical protein